MQKYCYICKIRFLHLTTIRLYAEGLSTYTLASVRVFFLIFIDLNIRLRIKYLKLLQKENDNDWSFVQNSAICSSRYIASRTRVLIKKVWVNLRGAKQRKKVRFTTASGGARGGANGCSKHLHLERVFFTDSQYFAEHQNGFGFLHLSN